MGIMILIEDVPMLLMKLKDCYQSMFRCCVVCVSRFPFPLSLLLPNHVLVVVVQVALGGKDVMVTKILIEEVLTLLMLIKHCRAVKQTKTMS